MQNSEREQPETSPPDSAFPSEPFACPACGQMLAPSCRVCVACAQPIDFTKIKRLRLARGTLVPQITPPKIARARFSWRIFLLVLAIWLVVGTAAQRLLGPVKAQLVLGGVVILSSVWVFFDAHEKRVAKPLRWGVGSLLMWILVFPWYLARRKTPQASCPFIEAEAGPLARVLLFALVIFFLLAVALVILKGPSPR